MRAAILELCRGLVSVLTRGRTFPEPVAFALGLDSLPKSQMALILDNRLVRGRNDEDFEHRVLPAFFRAVKGFSKIGNLVATPVGRLQIQRVTRANFGDAPVFFDEIEARRFAGFID